MMLPHLLLLDLDGVIVHEAETADQSGRELLRLHQDLPQRLADIPCPKVIVTHRSRPEAETILQAAHLSDRDLQMVVTAEDLLRVGLRYNVLRLLRRGLRKNLILPVLWGRFGVDPSRMIFIDDRLDNLEDMVGDGLGLGLHAPLVDGEDGTLLSFRFEELSEQIHAWRAAGCPAGAITSLAPVPVELAVLGRSGRDTRNDSRHAFNFVRSLARNARQSACLRPWHKGRAL